jgi:hypothetical protein
MTDDTILQIDNVGKPAWRLWCIAGGLLIAYIVAMLLPAMHATPAIGGGTNVDDALWGWEAFLFSFLLVHVPVWLANPLFGYGLVTILRGRDAATAIVGGVCTLLALFWPVLGMVATRQAPALRLGNFGIGYWLWLTCMVGLLLYGSIRCLRRVH